MKVLTIKEPYASLIANGYKKHEFRSWKTNYRGKLYIHASKISDKKELERFNYLNLKYRPGEIVAVCELVDCHKVSDIKINRNTEVYKNSPQDGYAWELINIKPLHNHDKIKGKLSIWNF